MRNRFGGHWEVFPRGFQFTLTLDFFPALHAEVKIGRKKHLGAQIVFFRLSLTSAWREGKISRVSATPKARGNTSQWPPKRYLMSGSTPVSGKNAFHKSDNLRGGGPDRAPPAKTQVGLSFHSRGFGDALSRHGCIQYDARERSGTRGVIFHNPSL